MAKRKKPAASAASPLNQTSNTRLSRLHDWGLAACLFLLPMWFNPTTQQVFELDKIMLFRSLVGVMALAWALQCWQTRCWPNWRSPLTWPLLGVILAFVLATVFSQVPITSLVGSYFRRAGLITHLHYWLFFGLLVAHIRRFEQLLNLVRWAVWGAVPVLVYALIQRLGLDPLPWGEMAFDQRVFSTLGQPNFLGGYLLVILPLAGYMAVTASRSWLKTIYALLTLWATTTLVLTGSRGALLGLVVLVLSTLLLLSLRQGKRQLWLAVGGGAVLIGLLAGLLWLPNPWQAELRRAIRFESATTQTRLYFWQGTLEGIADRPLAGHGPESMYATFPRYYDARIAETEGTDVTPDRAHNWLLDLGYTQGLVGLAAMLVWLATVGQLGLRSLKPSEKPQAWLLIALLAGLAAELTRRLVSFDTVVHALFFWFMLGAVVALHRLRMTPEPTPNVTKEPPTISGQTALVGSVGLLLILWLNLPPVLADQQFKQAQDAETSGNLASAAEHYRNARNLAPMQSQYDFYLADILLNQAQLSSDPERALAAAEESLSVLDNLRNRAPATPTSLRIRARAHTLIGHLTGQTAAFTEANAAYTKATELSPEKASLYDEWGVMLMQAGEFEAAQERFERALELFPNNRHFAHHQYRTHLAGALVYLKQYNAALEVMDKAFGAKGYPQDSYDARYVMASAYRLLGQTAEAIEQAELATQQNPSQPDAYRLLSELYAQRGDSAKSAAATEQLRLIAPNDPSLEPAR